MDFVVLLSAQRGRKEKRRHRKRKKKTRTRKKKSWTVDSYDTFSSPSSSPLAASSSSFRIDRHFHTEIHVPDRVVYFSSPFFPQNPTQTCQDLSRIVQTRVLELGGKRSPICWIIFPIAFSSTSSTLFCLTELQICWHSNLLIGS